MEGITHTGWDSPDPEARSESRVCAGWFIGLAAAPHLGAPVAVVIKMRSCCSDGTA
jgi:hypothetical protein